MMWQEGHILQQLAREAESLELRLEWVSGTGSQNNTHTLKYQFLRSKYIRHYAEGSEGSSFPPLVNFLNTTTKSLK